MGKKTASEGFRPHQKQKRKELFTQLATHQEAMVQEQDISNRPNARRYINEDSEEEVELDVLEHENKNLDSICEAVHKLLIKNKVSTKNAFQIPMIDLEQLPDFKDSLENDYAWKKLSSTLESDYKIYAYRVDAIHSITYSIVNSMARRQQDVDQTDPEQKKMEEGRPELMMKINEEMLEGEYLEKKIQNLNFNQLEVVTRMDPILERTKRQFDQLGTSSMMLDSLPLDEMLYLQLVRKGEGIQKYPPWGTYNENWYSDDPLMAFHELARFRNQLHSSIDGRINPESEQDDQMAFFLFNSDKENQLSQVNLPYQSYLLDKKDRYIHEEIRLKKQNSEQMREESEHWLQDLDRKFLGLRGSAKSKETLVKSQKWEEDPADMVDFSLEEQINKEKVFRPDPDKLEHKEDIEDRFLVTAKMANLFQPEKRTFLKEDWDVFQEHLENPQQMREEVDVRRQMVSIMEAKRKIKEQIYQKKSTFQAIYQKYSQNHEISPALCFLTLLHLANEDELTLQEIDTSNFYIC